MEAIDYGVARLTQIGVKKNPSHKSERVTQLLFGEHYIVLTQSEDTEWLRISIEADYYEGWIDGNQHCSISLEYFTQISHIDYKITTDLTSKILYKKELITLVMGSMLPISSLELFKMNEQFAFNGGSKNAGVKRDFDFLQNIALRYLNAPYEWGGRSPFGIDCSGFIQIIFKICGYKLPRDAFQQACHGKKVMSITHVKPGDLAFFSEGENKISHVGLMLNNKTIIHASGKVRTDQLTAEGIFNVEKNQYTHFLTTIRRVLFEF